MTEPNQEDPFQKLLRLTTMAAQLEHTIALQYLYAAFAMKDAFTDISGWGGSPLGTNLLGVAVQEMQHLHMVNIFRLALNQKPCMSRGSFPVTSPRYPFRLELEPLSQSSCWKYAFIEAPPGLRPKMLDQIPSLVAGAGPAGGSSSDGQNLIDELANALKASATERPEWFPDGLATLWLAKVDEVRKDGESDHYRFFWSLFEGAHAAFNPKERKPSASWDSPQNPMYPSLSLKRVRPYHSAQLFAQAIYELTCVLLHTSYLYDTWGQDAEGKSFPSYRGRRYIPNDEYAPRLRRERSLYWLSRDLMRDVFLPTGQALAVMELGVPFDGIDALPDDRAELFGIVATLAATARKQAKLAEAEGLARDFDLSILQWIEREK